MNIKFYYTPATIATSTRQVWEGNTLKMSIQRSNMPLFNVPVATSQVLKVSYTYVHSTSTLLCLTKLHATFDLQLTTPQPHPLTMACSAETENTPTLPREILVGLETEANSVCGLGSSVPCSAAE